MTRRDTVLALTAAVCVAYVLAVAVSRNAVKGSTEIDLTLAYACGFRAGQHDIGEVLAPSVAFSPLSPHCLGIGEVAARHGFDPAAEKCTNDPEKRDVHRCPMVKSDP